jgi:hypothetical protein
MTATPKAPHIIISILVLILLVGLVMGVRQHSLAQVLFMIAGLMGCVGFWRNPHYFGSTMTSLPGDVQRSYDRVGHLCFRASTLLTLAAICAFAVSH